MSLDGLPVGTQWLLAAGNAPQRLPFQITIPTEQPLLERRLRDPAWLGKKVELAVQPVVEVAEQAGEVIVIEILNRSHELLSFSEADLVLSMMTREASPQIDSVPKVERPINNSRTRAWQHPNERRRLFDLL